MRIGENRQLLQVGNLTQIDLLRELAADGGDQVFVGAQLPAGERPPAVLRLECALPQQHIELRLTRARLAGPVADLEYDGKHLVFGASMNHVFDYKSKTSDAD